MLPPNYLVTSTDSPPLPASQMSVYLYLIEPHLIRAVYHGKTGIVYNVTARAVGVICYKVVNGRYMEKRVNVRVEHVRHSKCRQEFLDRVKSNAIKKKEAKEKGEHVQLKRMPLQPRGSRVVSIKNNAPQTLTALPCELPCAVAYKMLMGCRRDDHLGRQRRACTMLRCIPVSLYMRTDVIVQERSKSSMADSPPSLLHKLLMPKKHASMLSSLQIFRQEVHNGLGLR